MAKRLSEANKIKLLEETVLTKDPDRLRAVIRDYAPFAFSARALGMACLYTNVEIVKIMVAAGMKLTFEYTADIRKLKLFPKEHAPMADVTETYTSAVVCAKMDWSYLYSEIRDIAVEPASEETRAQIASYLLTVPECGFDASTVLFDALVWDCIPVAEALRSGGVRLSQRAVDDLTIPPSRFRSSFVYSLMSQSPRDCAKSLQNLIAYLKEERKQLVLTQTDIKDLKEEKDPFTHAEVLKVLLAEADTSGLKQAEILKTVIGRDDADTLAFLAEAGWFKTPAQREKWVKLATDSKKTACVAWLLDYKNRAVDFAAEAAKAEKKLARALTENPNSVSALKKLWGFKKLEDGTLEITAYKGEETEVTVPAKIGKDPVSVIGESAFSPLAKRIHNAPVRGKITSVVLPEGVTEISKNAFYNCRSLASITLPSTLRTIGDRAFSGFGGALAHGSAPLTSIALPSALEFIGEAAFDGCESLDSITLPPMLKSIAPGVFSDCYSLSSITLPPQLNAIGACAFKNCKNLETLKIPESVTELGVNAFLGCEKLYTDEFVTNGCFVVHGTLISYIGNETYLTIPDNVERICGCAFLGSNLEAVRIPSSVKQIGAKAFWGCKKLKEVFFSVGLESIGDRAFSETMNICKITLPEGVVTLGEQALDCHGLGEISVPASVKSIGKYCFGYVSSPASIHTVEKSYAAAYAEKNYPRTAVFFDYGLEEA